MPSTRREWEKRVRGAQRALRDAKRGRRYVATGQLMGLLLFLAGIVLTAVTGGIGWVFVALLGAGMGGIASAMAFEWTMYQDVTDARDSLEDLTADFEAWKMEQATATVESF